MVATASDLSIVLTGGTSNIDPNESLGGDPSSTPISGVLNNLFENVNDDDALDGRIDYRCVYVFNDSASNTFYNMSYYLEAGGTGEVETGITFTHEVQRINIIGTVTGGSFSVSYTPPGLPLETQTVNYNADPNIWRANLETAINNISTLDVTVSVGGTGGNRIFDITFTDYRYHDVLTVNIGSLTGGLLTNSVSKITGGSPINSIPALLDASTTAPAGISFSVPSVGSPTTIGTLYPEEGFPLWVKRVTDAGTAAATNVGFNLKIKISPISS